MARDSIRIAPPVVAIDSVYSTGMVQGNLPICLDTPDWFLWLQTVTRFHVVLDHSIRYEALREQRRNRQFWYLRKRISGKLFKKYMGSSENISLTEIYAAISSINLAVHEAQINGEIPWNSVPAIGKTTFKQQPKAKRSQRRYSVDPLPNAPKLDSITLTGLSFTAKLIAEYLRVTPRQVTYAIEKLGIKPAEKRSLHDPQNTGMPIMQVYHKYSVEDINRIAEHVKAPKINPDCQLLKMIEIITTRTKEAKTKNRSQVHAA